MALFAVPGGTPHPKYLLREGRGRMAINIHWLVSAGLSFLPLVLKPLINSSQIFVNIGGLDRSL